MSLYWWSTYDSVGTQQSLKLFLLVLSRSLFSFPSKFQCLNSSLLSEELTLSQRLTIGMTQVCHLNLNSNSSPCHWTRWNSSLLPIQECVDLSQSSNKKTVSEYRRSCVYNQHRRHMYELLPHSPSGGVLVGGAHLRWDPGDKVLGGATAFPRLLRPHLSS